MINAPGYTFFGAGHGIGRPGQADSERSPSTIQGQADKLRGAGAVRHSLVNARPSRAPQGYAGMDG